MSKYPRVKDLLIKYNAKGMKGVEEYLMDEDLIIDPLTWIGKQKKLLEEKKFQSMEAEIASILFKINLTKEK